MEKKNTSKNIDISADNLDVNRFVITGVST
jgi:hypothetical protein